MFPALTTNETTLWDEAERAQLNFRKCFGNKKRAWKRDNSSFHQIDERERIKRRRMKIVCWMCWENSYTLIKIVEKRLGRISFYCLIVTAKHSLNSSCCSVMFFPWIQMFSKKRGSLVFAMIKSFNCCCFLKRFLLRARFITTSLFFLLS